MKRHIGRQKNVVNIAQLKGIMHYSHMQTCNARTHLLNLSARLYHKTIIIKLPPYVQRPCNWTMIRIGCLGVTLICIGRPGCDFAHRKREHDKSIRVTNEQFRQGTSKRTGIRLCHKCPRNALRRLPSQMHVRSLSTSAHTASASTLQRKTHGCPIDAKTPKPMDLILLRTVPRLNPA